MMKKMPYHPFEQLQESIETPAKELGWESLDLLPELTLISIDYIKAIEDYQKSATRGEVLRSLTEVLERPDQKLAGGIAILGREAIQAMLGRFPNAFARYTDVHGNDHLTWIANDDAIMRAAFKSRMALQSRLNQSTLVRIEIHRTGFEPWQFNDERSARSHLQATAETDPALMRQLIRHTINFLTKVFQFGDTRGGRNTKILDGARANADWQLFNLILNVIWPIERGELHSTKMMPVRDIINGVMTYVWGDKPKRGKGNRIRDRKEGLNNEENGLFFDNNLFSNVLTLRHQINSLACAIEKLDRKFMEIDGSRDAFHDAGRHLIALDRLAINPLRDWKNELERRLLFGDYRPHERGIRRPTGEILPIPAVPRFRKAMTEYERLRALIEAALPLVKGEQGMEEDKRLLESVFPAI